VWTCSDFRSASGVDLHLLSDGAAIVRIDFGTHVTCSSDCEPGDCDVLQSCALQLDEYFNRERTAFDLPLHPRGTDFQLRVWKALEEIPYGETRSYSEIARSIGSPDAVRAVGAANGRNPLPIVVPCHRVIGANGSLTGFGGGLPLKKLLLELESGNAPLWT
jgi:methylated-DNA-[protein]-cysteine S-methyltransferase